MKNADTPAMPVTEMQWRDGLTKREHFAAMAIRGFSLALA